MKKIIANLNVFILTVFSKLAVAGVGDPFEKATEKTNAATELLSGNFAVAFGSLVLVVAGIAWMMGKLRVEWAIRICGGALLVASAGAVANWLFV